MIAEKAWAKIHGTYALIGKGGSMSAVFQALSDDPVKRIRLREPNGGHYNFLHNNAKGDKLWADMVKWTAKEYVMFFGTDDLSWVKGHAYAIVWAREYTIDGVKSRWIQARNPWGSNKWK